MKTRMTKTSLIANLATNKPKGCALIFRYIIEHTQSNYKMIATGLKMPVPTVVARLNDLMYDHQLIKITGISGNMQLYSERLESDPLNVRPESKVERLEKEVKELTSFITELKNKVELYTGEKVQITHINCDLNHK